MHREEASGTLTWRQGLRQVIRHMGLSQLRQLAELLGYLARCCIVQLSQQLPKRRLTCIFQCTLHTRACHLCMAD